VVESREFALEMLKERLTRVTLRNGWREALAANHAAPVVVWTVKMDAALRQALATHGTATAC
jgi:hypothetical protein